MKNTKGFTLVELAIVLVIIGLLVGGTLQGQELIHQAQIRSVLRTISDTDTAVNTFRSKYDALPGDFKLAAEFGIDRPSASASANLATTITSTTGDGDGDGRLGFVTSSYFVANFSGEIANFWVMLSNARLIKGSFNQISGCTASETCNGHVGSAFPSLPIGIGMIALTDVDNNDELTYVLGVPSIDFSLPSPCGWDGATFIMQFACNPALGPGTAATTLIPEDAYSIDAKLDDGIPHAGIVQSFFMYGSDGSGYTPDNPVGAADHYTYCIIDDGSGNMIYNLQYKLKGCQIHVRASA